ncbi:unnamed protein product [Dovyalis caffra]|uniref:Phospholipid/glycerol acyltransferase domain-containing protein n=1 Tax=Dovyalis caffra TaxID=77055 RepID=A0AAV1S712_9ROSI|nr:unnamed protein product [Dovyalis caffra]
MARKSFPMKPLVSFLSEIPFRLPRNVDVFRWNNVSISNAIHDRPVKFQKYISLVQRSGQLSNQTLVFHLEGALLRSSSLFPYFMPVAFEAAGGIFRSVLLFLLYPLVWLVGKEMGLKIMVFVCFVGIRKDKFRVGTAVLPRFFLEDVGREGFDIVMSCGKKIAVSDLPTVMVEGFLKDYLSIEAVVGRELKVINGYFVGLMEDKKAGAVALNERLGEKIMGSHAIAFGSFSFFLDEQLFTHCEEVYWVTDAEKKNWHVLPRKRYPKPLIFQDGRLAFRPTPLATLAMFMWIPLGFFLFITRLIVSLLLPYKVAFPILASSGMRSVMSIPEPLATSNKKQEKRRGTLYVCNHRTMIDPLYVAAALLKPSLAAATHRLDKFNAVVAPIKTISLIRDREKDAKTMDKLLSQGDLVLFPEGTTSREPYQLRFSPLFAEMSDDIVPVALDVQVSMFYGSTAVGLKCLDSVFQLLNPYPTCNVKILEKVPSSETYRLGGKSRFEVANYVQNEIAESLGFECTSLTRKDKYKILAGMSQGGKKRSPRAKLRFPAKLYFGRRTFLRAVSTSQIISGVHIPLGPVIPMRSKALK